MVNHVILSPRGIDMRPAHLRRSANKQPQSRHLISRIYIQSLSATSSQGHMQIGSLYIPCLLGKNGMSFSKREGDGRTPRGRFVLDHFYVRPAQHFHYASHHKFKSISSTLKWCDHPFHPLYNRPTHQPLQTSYEKLWRDDQLYNIIGVIDYNFTKRIAQHGSAIFLHLYDAHTQFTHGCIALSERHMRHILPSLSARPVLYIGQR